MSGEQQRPKNFECLDVNVQAAFTTNSRPCRLVSPTPRARVHRHYVDQEHEDGFGVYGARVFTRAHMATT